MKKALFITYFLFLSLVTLFSYFFVDPNLIYLKNLYTGFAFQYRLQTTILYVLIIFLFFIFYFLFLWFLKKGFLNTKDIKLLIFITVGVLFFSYPAMLSYDIFNYIATAKVLYFYHENPYIIMPIELVGDPLLTFTHAANKIALYGPIWVILSVIPYILGFGNFVITLLNFKLFIGIFYLATIFLIWKMSKNMISVILFAFNPLVVIETLISGHNDVVMIFFAILSFFLLTRKKVGLALLFFILSILIKYATIFLIPVFVYTLWNVVRKKTPDWEKVFYFSALLMIGAFLLSPIREEIYPWYAIWFMPFISIVYNKSKSLLYISLAFSFSLLLRYIPFMFLGTYDNPTPSIKTLVTFVPLAIVLMYFTFSMSFRTKL